MQVDCHAACWRGYRNCKCPDFCDPSDNAYLSDGMELNIWKWLRWGVTAKLYVSFVNRWNYWNVIRIEFQPHSEVKHIHYKNQSVKTVDGDNCSSLWGSHKTRKHRVWENCAVL